MHLLNLTNFTPAFVDTIQNLLPYKLENTNAIININVEDRQLHVDPVDKKPGTEAVDVIELNEYTAKLIAGYVALANVVRNAMPDASWEFIEYVITNFGPAFAEGELVLVDQLTEEMINDSLEQRPFLGIRREYIQRWVEQGVACLTDVVVRDDLMLGNSGVTTLPKVYPVIMVGKYLAFNQTLPEEHFSVAHTLEDDENAPVVAGAIIFRSTGTANVVQTGYTANVEYDGRKFVADVMGVREIQLTEK